MRPKYKKYILENINKKPIEEISQELNLKEREIRRLLEKEKQKRKQADSKKEVKTHAKKQTIFISIALIIILGFTVYGNSLNGKFIWDDDVLVKDNLYIKNWSKISKIFSEDIFSEDTGAGATMKSNFYRPLQIFTYMVDYSLWRLDVKGYHLTNILLHILAALGIYWLITILYHDRFLSLFTSILFIIHPIHTEAVAYISGRADSLALGFMLFCFILYVKSLRRGNVPVYILMVFSYILALLSKESSLIFPILLLLYHYTFKEKIRVKGFISIVSITFIYILLRITILKSFLSNIAPCSTTLSQRLPGFFVAITNYIRLIILPFNLHMEYGNKLFALSEPKAIAGILILSSLLIYAFRKRHGNGLIFFSLSWFLITLLPVSNLYPINAYMAEHWLYVPSIGAFLIFTKGLSSLYKTKNFRIFSIIIVIGLLGFYSYLTIRQNKYWREPMAFYERTRHYAPHSKRVYNNLGNAYTVTGNVEEAIASYKKAIELRPNYAEAYNNLAVMYKSIAKYEDAIISYKKSIELRPNYAEAYSNLGAVYHAIGKTEEAIASCKKAIDLNPDYAEAYSNLGAIYHTIARIEEAIALYKKAIKTNPDYAEAYYNLGYVYSAIGEIEESIGFYKKAIKTNPNYAKAYNNLGSIYSMLAEHEEAIVAYKKAIEINSNDAYAYNNLGNAYNAMRKTEEAIARYKKAIDLSPNYATAHTNLAIVYYYDKQYTLAIKHCDMAIELGSKVNPEFVRLLKPYRE